MIAANLYHSQHSVRDDLILVTGLAGVPGWNLFHGLRRLYPGRVVGQRPVDNAKAIWEDSFPINSEERSKVQQLFAERRFAAVIDASGNCALKACECHPELSKILNHDFAVSIAEECAIHDIPLLRISSDFVFSGAAGVGNYFEDDPMDPVTMYGKHTALAELNITKTHPSAIFLRVPLPIGLSPGGKAGAIDWIEWRFRNGRPATLYFDEYRSVISMHDLVKVVDLWLQKPEHFAPGIYHCGGPRDVSLYQIGQIINAVGGYDPKLLHGCMRIDAGPMPPRAGHVGINCEKLYRLLPPGMIRPWPLTADMYPGDDREWHFTVNRENWKINDSIGANLMDGVYFLPKA